MDRCDILFLEFKSDISGYMFHSNRSMMLASIYMPIKSAFIDFEKFSLDVLV